MWGGNSLFVPPTLHLWRQCVEPGLHWLLWLLLLDGSFSVCSRLQRADIDFAYVTDHKLVEECKTDCKSPFVIMYKAGESEQPRCAHAGPRAGGCEPAQQPDAAAGLG